MNRRKLLHASAAGLAFYTTRGLFAEQLAQTPAVEEGPFYPNKLLVDTDNDLIVLNNNLTPAVGEVTHLAGRLLDSKGEPVRGATIEIWQVDSNGTYLKEHTMNGAQMDGNFQGFGRFLTGSKGEYNFRTIKPIPYRSRQAPHIHFKVKTKGHDAWNTQLFIKGHPGNVKDGVYQKIRGNKDLVTLDFTPIAKSSAGELAVKFDIVLGWTPEIT